MTRSANLGFPRIGQHRELKKALEAYWQGTADAADLEATGKALRARHWQLQRDAGIEVIPSNDFSFYDHMLDLSATLGAVPPRFHDIADPLLRYFAMARGTGTAPAMEMTKWFDTNYHFIVPELHVGQQFRLASSKAVGEFLEARALGIHTRPVLVGPVTWLSLAKSKDAGLERRSAGPMMCCSRWRRASCSPAISAGSTTMPSWQPGCMWRGCISTWSAPPSNCPPC